VLSKKAAIFVCTGDGLTDRSGSPAACGKREAALLLNRIKIFRRGLILANNIEVMICSIEGMSDPP
jgi:hypothetical protein